MFEAIASEFNGVARFSSTVSGNGQTNNLGTIKLDEDDPRVVKVGSTQYSGWPTHYNNRDPHV